MKNFITTTLLLLFLMNLSFGQNLSQTVRGTLLDADSRLPLIGAALMIVGTDPLVGTATDENGKFKLENIPIGRIDLQLSYLGYEDQLVPNVEVNSGKEVVLNLSMQESIVKMEEVVVTATQNQGEVLNDMTLISARAISAEKTERYAGGFNDPSRIVSSFAGVATTNDGDNDIIVRGNSPKYIQWRLEGVEITNPNHFADQNSIRGGVSALNNNLLATSDFHTGAFSPEFGDVLSGIYDVKLRAGNNEKFEATFGFGLLGTDLTLEGPFKKGYGGSYLLNYRYSTISLVNDFGLINIDGILSFQDATFKIVLPTAKTGVFSFFGLGGISNFSLEDVKADLFLTPGDDPMDTELREDYDKGSDLANLGMNHTLSIGKNSFLKSSVTYASNGIKEEVFESKTKKIYNTEGVFLQDSILRSRLDYKSKLRNATYRAAVAYHNKLNAKSKIQIGVKYALFDYDYDQSWFQDEKNTRFVAADFKENIATIRNYFSWKYRWNEELTLVAGLHNMNVLFNGKHTLEPRIAGSWKISNTGSFKLGYGNHSKMESIHNYFARVALEDGSIIEPNRDLDLLKAHHFVFAYEKRFNKQLMAKVELYYQHLYNLPVENKDTSYYATINEGTEFRYVDLVNEGTGKNYGIELSLERFFDNNYYYLINASLFQSKYKSLEGIERNTQYNGNYLINFLVGKEFDKLGKKENKTLSVNAKAFFGGGKKILRLLRDEQGNLAVNPSKGQYWDYEKAYEDKIGDVYLIVLSASYKLNRPRATHEIFINLDNITNNKGKLTEFYDEDAPNSIGHLAQFGFFPNLMYRVYF